jgi:hypothetical protein
MTVARFDLDDYIKRLQQLRDLLRDPEIAAIARTMLSVSATQEHASNGSGAIANAIPTSPQVPIKPARKRGALVRAVFEVTRRATSPMSAKGVTEALESNGFAFGAQDRQVAVSKALRTLWKQNKIEAEQNGGKKSAIFYRPKGSAQQNILMQ